MQQQTTVTDELSTRQQQVGLTAQIMSATDLDTLSDLLDRYGPQMNHFHISALMICLVKLSAEPDRPTHRSHKRDTRRSHSYDAGDADAASHLAVLPGGVGRPDELDAEGGVLPVGVTLRGRGRRGLHSPSFSLLDGTEDDSSYNDDDSYERGRSSSTSSGRREQGRKPISGKRGARAKDARAHAVQLARRTLRLLQPQILECDGRGLVNVLYAMARLEIRDPIIDDLLYVSTHHLEDFAPQVGVAVCVCVCVALCPCSAWTHSHIMHSCTHTTPPLPPPRTVAHM